MIRIRWREDDGPHDTPDTGRIAELLARPDVLVWIDLEDPSETERALLRDPLHFHHLAIEDSVNSRQRPKLEEYDDWFFFVTHEVAFDAAAESEHAVRLRQIAVFVRERCVVTVHQEPVHTVDEMWLRCEERAVTLRRGAGYFLYTLLDALTDRYFPLLDLLDDRMDMLEDRIVQAPGRDVLEEIFNLKRVLIGLRKIVGPTRESVNTLMTRNFPAIDDDCLPYLRDVGDHLVRIYEILDTYRDVMSSALDAYLSTVSNQMNFTMQRLTIITVIFLPLTFITGVFGMNFKTQPWMPAWDQGQVFWTVMVSMGLLALGIAWWFHRKRLL